MDNKHTIYLNMCHHYRKIFNAKSCVNTFPSKAFTKNANYRDKKGTSALFMRTSNKDSGSLSIPNKLVFKEGDSPAICPYFLQHHLTVPYDMKKSYRDKSFSVSKKPFHPKILKNNVQSKLHYAHTYHSPRKRRPEQTTDKTLKLSQSLNNNDQREKNVRVHNPLNSNTKTGKFSSISAFENNYSEESSEDSAYNEGECIHSSDSRGSTPQILSVKNQLTQKSFGIVNSDEINTTKITQAQYNTNSVVYVQFLKEITSDILQKNILTNKAIRIVFQHHIAINKYHLNMDKMVEEITKLQECLGISKNNQNDDEDYGLGTDLSHEVFEEKDELIDNVAASNEQPDNGHNKKENHKENEGQLDDNDDDYSDNFSDISSSDAEKSEDDVDVVSEEGRFKSEKLNDNSIRDCDENYA